jgi:uroporphyrin-III C-methyltransferase/precorrin-2 dehydrogenase/sirohydrochlorin ferrochelatase
LEGLLMHTVPRTLPRKRDGAPIAALSRLPVFFNLHDKVAVVAGGSDAVLWKVQLLGAAGARVRLFAPHDGVADACRCFLDTARKSFSIEYVPRSWCADDLHGAAIAVVDAVDNAEAKRFCEAASASSVPSNVIDNRAFGTIEFGSVVNRSPVVIGISTAGAAPFLAQAIRSRVERLLPPALAMWASLAQRIRKSVSAQLPSPTQRRAFWETFSARAFGSAPQGDDDDYLPTSTSEHRPVSGSVTLVGAGPGDAQLLTLKAVHALQTADVILFDDQVSDEVLELARREAKRMLVGKRGGRQSCSQTDINELMVKLARAGRRVVRLKSGDPMIFGRAGEEIARLHQAGIDVQVIPGITSALAMASALGVSLTHRDCAQSVRFVTGHACDGALPNNIDWRAVADPSATTVFYMSGRTATQIARRLDDHGMSPSTPRVICAAVSRPAESRWHGTLRDIAEGIARVGIEQPVLVAVGQVFAAQHISAAVASPK